MEESDAVSRASVELTAAVCFVLVAKETLGRLNVSIMALLDSLEQCWMSRSTVYLYTV